jgi:hypothetical protein
MRDVAHRHGGCGPPEHRCSRQVSGNYRRSDLAGFNYAIDYDDTSYDDYAEVQAKKDAAVQWCHHASTHALSRGSKPWKYQLIPHNAISDNVTLLGLANQYHID